MTASDSEGMSRFMLIAQISDTHIAGPGKKAYGIAPMADNLVRCIRHINQCAPRPDVVFVTGDITCAGSRAENHEAATILTALCMPYYVIPGNHDDRTNLRTAFGERAGPLEDQDFIAYGVEGFDVRMIAMDSTAPGAPGGEICQTRAAWLDEKLSEAPQKPTAIFMHHPPVKCGILETDEDGFDGADLLAEVIASYNNIEGIFCGHTHLPIHVRWCGTVVSTMPSMGMQLGLDLTQKRPSEFVLEAPAYQLHFWTPQKNLVTHTVYVRDAEGPYLFEEQT